MGGIQQQETIKNLNALAVRAMAVLVAVGEIKGRFVTLFLVRTAGRNRFDAHQG